MVAGFLQPVAMQRRQVTDDGLPAYLRHEH
jgi:hypothetical protein